MQPPGTIKNHATSQDKKSRNLSGQKITQPLGTKQITQTLRTKKNHATSRDKKISCNLLGQSKITQPLRTKNHATSRDKKITQPFSNFCQHIVSLSQFTLVQFSYSVIGFRKTLIVQEVFFIWRLVTCMQDIKSGLLQNILQKEKEKKLC